MAALLADEVMRLLVNTPDQGRWSIEAARDILEHGCLQREFPQFLTEYGYRRYLVHRAPGRPDGSLTGRCGEAC